MARSSWKALFTKKTHLSHLLFDYVETYSMDINEYGYQLFSIDLNNKPLNLLIPRFKRIQDLLELEKRTNFKYKIYNRSLMLNSLYKGFVFYIHKGNAFRTLKYNTPLNTLKFGEFSFSRKPFYFPVREKKKKFIKR